MIGRDQSQRKMKSTRHSTSSRLRKNSKICYSEARSVFERGENLLFPWRSCEQQIPHPQTTRVRDDKRAFFRSLLGISHACARALQARKWTRSALARGNKITKHSWRGTRSVSESGKCS